MVESKATNVSGNSASQQPKVGLLKQYLKTKSFDLNPAIIARRGDTSLSPNVKVNVFAEASEIEKNKLYEANLTVDIVAESGSTEGKGIPDRVFGLTLIYSGIFAPENIPQADLSPFLLIYCPSILFPFARQIVANTTLEAGLPALMLEMIDFEQMYQDNASPTSTNNQNNVPA